MLVLGFCDTTHCWRSLGDDIPSSLHPDPNQPTDPASMTHNAARFVQPSERFSTADTRTDTAFLIDGRVCHFIGPPKENGQT